MGAKKQLLSDKIGTIIALHKCGKSQTNISNELDISQSTVHFQISRHKSSGDGKTPAPIPKIVLGGLERKIYVLINQ